jgi:hypothetical protein
MFIGQWIKVPVDDKQKALFIPFSVWKKAAAFDA